MKYGGHCVLSMMWWSHFYFIYLLAWHIIKFSVYHNNQYALFTRCQFCMVISKLPPSTYSSCTSITHAPFYCCLCCISHSSFTINPYVQLFMAQPESSAWGVFPSPLTHPLNTLSPTPHPTPPPNTHTQRHTYTLTHTPSLSPLSKPLRPLSCLPPSLSALGWHVMVALVCSLPLPLVY